MTMIKIVIVSSGFNIFNTFINHYDQGFILNMEFLSISGEAMYMLQFAHYIFDKVK